MNQLIHTISRAIKSQRPRHQFAAQIVIAFGFVTIALGYLVIGATNGVQAQTTPPAGGGGVVAGGNVTVPSPTQASLWEIGSTQKIYFTVPSEALVNGKVTASLWWSIADYSTGKWRPYRIIDEREFSPTGTSDNSVRCETTWQVGEYTFKDDGTPEPDTFLPTHVSVIQVYVTNSALSKTWFGWSSSFTAAHTPGQSGSTVSFGPPEAHDRWPIGQNRSIFMADGSSGSQQISRPISVVAKNSDGYWRVYKLGQMNSGTTFSWKVGKYNNNGTDIPTGVLPSNDVFITSYSSTDGKYGSSDYFSVISTTELPEPVEVDEIYSNYLIDQYGEGAQRVYVIGKNFDKAYGNGGSYTLAVYTGSAGSSAVVKPLAIGYGLIYGFNYKYHADNAGLVLDADQQAIIFDMPAGKNFGVTGDFTSIGITSLADLPTDYWQYYWSKTADTTDHLHLVPNSARNDNAVHLASPYGGQKALFNSIDNFNWTVGSAYKNSSYRVDFDYYAIEQFNNVHNQYPGFTIPVHRDFNTIDNSSSNGWDAAPLGAIGWGRSKIRVFLTRNIDNRTVVAWDETDAPFTGYPSTFSMTYVNVSDTTPVRDDTWRVGETQPITIKTSALYSATNPVRIFLEKLGSQNEWLPNDDLVRYELGSLPISLGTEGTFNWVVGTDSSGEIIPDIKSGDWLRIAVSVTNENYSNSPLGGVFDLSGRFHIADAKRIAIQGKDEQTGGLVLHWNEDNQIDFDLTGGVSAVKIEQSRDSGNTWSVIEDNLAVSGDSGSYTWNPGLPGAQDNANGMRMLRISDVSDPGIFDTAHLSIVSQPLNVNLVVDKSVGQKGIRLYPYITTAAEGSHYSAITVTVQNIGTEAMPFSTYGLYNLVGLPSQDPTVAGPFFVIPALGAGERVEILLATDFNLTTDKKCAGAVIYKGELDVTRWITEIGEDASGLPLQTEGIFYTTPSFGLEGAEVSVFGTNFGAEQNNREIRFGGVAATEYVSWSNEVIVVKVPAGAVSGRVTLNEDDNVVYEGTWFNIGDAPDYCAMIENYSGDNTYDNRFTGVLHLDNLGAKLELKLAEGSRSSALRLNEETAVDIWLTPPVGESVVAADITIKNSNVNVIDYVRYELSDLFELNGDPIYNDQTGELKLLVSADGVSGDRVKIATFYWQVIARDSGNASLSLQLGERGVEGDATDIKINSYPVTTVADHQSEMLEGPTGEYMGEAAWDGTALMGDVLNPTLSDATDIETAFTVGSDPFESTYYSAQWPIDDPVANLSLSELINLTSELSAPGGAQIVLGIQFYDKDGDLLVDPLGHPDGYFQIADIDNEGSADAGVNKDFDLSQFSAQTLTWFDEIRQIQLVVYMATPDSSDPDSLPWVANLTVNYSMQEATIGMINFVSGEDDQAIDNGATIEFDLIATPLPGLGEESVTVQLGLDWEGDMPDGFSEDDFDFVQTISGQEVVDDNLYEFAYSTDSTGYPFKLRVTSSTENKNTADYNFSVTGIEVMGAGETGRTLTAAAGILQVNGGVVTEGDIDLSFVGEGDKDFQQGDTASYGVLITSVNNFSGTVTLSTNLASQVSGIGTPVWTPSNEVSVAAGGTAYVTLSVLIDEDADDQSNKQFTITATAAGGDISDTLTGYLTIDADAPDRPEITIHATVPMQTERTATQPKFYFRLYPDTATARIGFTYQVLDIAPTEFSGNDIDITIPAGNVLDGQEYEGYIKSTRHLWARSSNSFIVDAAATDQSYNLTFPTLIAGNVGPVPDAAQFLEDDSINAIDWTTWFSEAVGLWSSIFSDFDNSGVVNMPDLNYIYGDYGANWFREGDLETRWPQS
ncbi:MAG: IPT/TIG domain-containing protein [Patescibacteria group bacterium]|jgi:hypothetical protein